MEIKEPLKWGYWDDDDDGGDGGDDDDGVDDDDDDDDDKSMQWFDHRHRPPGFNLPSLLLLATTPANSNVHSASTFKLSNLTFSASTLRTAASL